MGIAGFNWLDWTIIGVIVLSTLVGVIRGFVREGLSLVVWALAFWAGFALSNSLSTHFSQHIPNSSIRYGVSFAILFVGVLIIGGVINYMISQAVRKTGLGGTDRFLGLFFGFARGVLVIGIVMLLAGLTPVNKEKFWQDSKITPHFSGLVAWIHSMLPKSIEQHLLMTIGNSQSTSQDVKVNARDINAPSVPANEEPKTPDATTSPSSSATPDNENDTALSQSLENAQAAVDPNAPQTTDVNVASNENTPVPDQVNSTQANSTN